VTQANVHAKPVKFMENANLLVIAMAQKCRGLIQEWETPDVNLPEALQPKHLLWICDEIDKHAEDIPANRVHRWIGFIQAAMMAHRRCGVRR
jgi:hypothetical protein